MTGLTAGIKCVNFFRSILMDLRNIFRHEPPFSLTYLNDLGDAIMNVDEKYCHWAYRIDYTNQKTERVFTYELYHQFRLMAGSKPQYYNDLRLDGEIGKRLADLELENCGSATYITQGQFSPDLVIHLAQTNREEEYQKLVIEAKTKYVRNDELGEAIIKLNHYIRVLSFQYAILISVNTDFNRLLGQIRAIFPKPKSDNLLNRFGRIIIMSRYQETFSARPLLEICN